MTIDHQYGTVSDLQPGDVVFDDLTGTTATVLEVDYDKFGNCGIWLDNDYLGGGRHPWEVSAPR